VLVSDFVGLWRTFFSLSPAAMVFIASLLIAIAVMTYRLARNIGGPLVLSGVLAGTLFIALLFIEQGTEVFPQAAAIAALAGVGRAVYEIQLKRG
jgi:hypothetical protein